MGLTISPAICKSIHIYCGTAHKEKLCSIADGQQRNGVQAGIAVDLYEEYEIKEHFQVNIIGFRSWEIFQLAHAPIHCNIIRSVYCTL